MVAVRRQMVKKTKALNKKKQIWLTEQSNQVEGCEIHTWMCRCVALQTLIKDSGYKRCSDILYMIYSK